MNILCLSVVFPVIVVTMWLRKPLFVAMIGGMAATIILFRVSLKDTAVVLERQTVAWDTIGVLLSFYLIIFSRLILERKGRLTNTKDSFNRLLGGRRMSIIVSPVIMGFLPSAAVMTICVDTVNRTREEYMDGKNKALVSCYYRYTPEAFLPTLPAILLGPTLNEQNAGVFALAMIPMAVVACLVAYITHLKGIPRKMPLLEETIDKEAEIINPVKNLWTLTATFLIIITFNPSVCIATPLVIAFNYIFSHFGLEDLPDLMVRSAESILLSSIYLTMLFKGILSYTGAIGLLLNFIGQFPTSMTISFGLLLFIGAIISGSQTIIALCMSITLLAFPQGRIPFLAMLVSVAWTAMQISPTHVCPLAAADFYHTTLGSTVTRALGPVIILLIIVYGYGLLLGQIFYQRICKQKLMIQGGEV